MTESMAEGGAILIVDDDLAHGESLRRIFEREEITAVHASGGEEALAWLKRRRFGVLLTDLMMPGMSGMALLRAAKVVAPETEVIVMTAFGTVETAVEAMREGALDFVTKPFKRIQIVRSVKRALASRALEKENKALKAELEQHKAAGEMVGRSPAFQEVVALVKQVAPTQAAVLIEGESGTGKEMVAQALHRLSSRANKPLITLNCAALPEGLLEAELFGHEKGAFTGASQQREGRFELADGGSLFLDEVAEMSPQLQAKLLRVLQEGEFSRVGGNQTLKVDVRIIAATNKPLQEEAAAGRFREDLYYRLHVIKIALPPLREREGDIPLLAQYFLERHAAANGKGEGLRWGPGVMEALSAWPWRGNVRELNHVVERAVILSRGPVLGLEMLPESMLKGQRPPTQLSFQVGMTLAEVERAMIDATLEATGGDKQAAAQLLGITARTIYRKLS